MVITSIIDDLYHVVNEYLYDRTLPEGFTGENWGEMAGLTLKFHFGRCNVRRTWSDRHRIDGAKTPWGIRAAFIAKGRKRKATAEPGALQRDAVIWSAGIHGFCSKKQWTSSPWESALRGGNGMCHATLVFPTVEQFKNPTPMDIPPAACNLEDEDVKTAVKSYNRGFRLMEKDGKMHRAMDSTILAAMRTNGIHTEYAESLAKSIGRSLRNAKATSRFNSMTIKYKHCDTVCEDDVTAAMYLSVLLEKLGRLGEVTKDDCARDGGGSGIRQEAAAGSGSDTLTAKGKGRRVSGSESGGEEAEGGGTGSSFEFPGFDEEAKDAPRASNGEGSGSGAGSDSGGETDKETPGPTRIALELFAGQRSMGQGPLRADDVSQKGSVDNVEQN